MHKRVKKKKWGTKWKKQHIINWDWMVKLYIKNQNSTKGLGHKIKN